MVKGNAYGHGMSQVVSILEAHVDAFQIDDVEELRELRRVSQRPAFVFGYVPAFQVREVVELDGEFVIYDWERLDAISKAGKQLGVRPKVHVKIDALLGRQGLLPRDLPDFIPALRSAELDVKGIYAHFANIEDTTDSTHAQAQIDVFEEAWSQLAPEFPGVVRHLSATSAVMTIEGEIPTNDWVRVGAGMYGLYPSASLARTHRHLELRPVLTWKSHLAQVKWIPAGHPVGYGLTYRANGETKLGIVPQGYADGFDRGLSNSGEVLVRGQRCPVLGRVAMNMFAIDLTHVEGAVAEDEVVLLGAQGQERITAEEVAAKVGTIHYEVVTRISPLLPRTIGPV